MITMFKVNGKKFYMLESLKGIWVSEKEDEIILQLKEESKDKNLDIEKTKLVEIEIGEKWNITQISWAKIAIKLLKGT